MKKILTVAAAASMIAFSAFAEDAATNAMPTIPAACSEDAAKASAKTVADLSGKDISEACKAALAALAPAAH